MSEASNAQAPLHDEEYDKPFNPQNLNSGGMMFSRNRPVQSLNGTWTFTVDACDTGLRQHWYRDCHLPIEGRTAPWDYDVHNGETIQVPSCWNLAEPRYFHYEGSTWFGRRFSYMPENHGERVFLRNVAQVAVDLGAVRPNHALLAQREAIDVWQPLYDRTVALFVSLIDGAPPRVSVDVAGAQKDASYP